MFAEQRLKNFFSQISFPSEFAIIGSGNTKPPKDWEGIPSLRFNEETMHPEEKYPFLPIFMLICNKGSFKRCKKIHKEKYPKVYLFEIDSKEGALLDNLEGTRRATIGVKWEKNAFPTHIDPEITN